MPWCQSAGCKGTADTRHLRAERLTIRVDESQVSIDGKGVTLPTERQVLIDILGEPSRVSRRANTLLTWDQLGLVAYEEPNDGLIVQITVALGAMTFDFWPQRAFSGALELQGAALRSDTAMADLVRSKQVKGLIANSKQPYMADAVFGDL